MKGIRVLSTTGLVTVLLALAACGQEVAPAPADTALPPKPATTLTSPPVATPAVLPTAMPDPTTIPAATATPAPASPPVPAVAPTATTEPTAAPTAAPTPSAKSAVPEGLFLKITSLPKESVVRTRTVPISGLTSPDALVSVNGILVDVDSEGGFTTSVSLNDGTNLVEVFASDFKGNDVSAVLTIIYIP